MPWKVASCINIFDEFAFGEIASSPPVTSHRRKVILSEKNVSTPSVLRAGSCDITYQKHTRDSIETSIPACIGKREVKGTHAAVRGTIDRNILKQEVLRPEYSHRPELTLSEVEAFEDGVCSVEDDEVDRSAGEVRYALREIVPIRTLSISRLESVQR